MSKEIPKSMLPNENYSPMKNNILEQSARICELVSDAGKFSTFYNELNDNIIATMNEMIKQYTKNSRKAIRIDVFDEVMKTIKWSDLNEKLREDIKNKQPIKIPKFKPIDTNMKKFSIDLYDNDSIVDMYSYMDEETVEKFAESQDEAIEKLHTLADDVTTFETSLCAYRAKTVEKMVANIDSLYALHANYVRAIKNKQTDLPISKTIGDKEIKFYKSQKEFITNGIKSLLGLDSENKSDE